MPCKILSVTKQASLHVDYAASGAQITIWRGSRSMTGIFRHAELRELRDELLKIVPLPATPPKASKAKKSTAAQGYKGNGKHVPEMVHTDPNGAGYTYRLRVPGGWNYTTVTQQPITRVLGGRAEKIGTTVVAQSTVFVPMPEVVKHAI